MEAGLGGRIDFGTYVRTRDGILFILEDAPAFERAYIDPIEGNEAFFRELAGRAQLTSAERGGGPSESLEICLDPAESSSSGTGRTNRARSMTNPGSAETPPEY